MPSQDKYTDGAFKKYNIPRSITINGYELTFKDPPLQDDIYRYRCRKSGCNYFIKISKENLNKINNKKENTTF